MAIGFYGAVLDENSEYQGVWFGRTEDDLIRNIKLNLEDSRVHGNIALSNDDLVPMPNGRLEFSVGDNRWTIEIGPIDFEN